MDDTATTLTDIDVTVHLNLEEILRSGTTYSWWGPWKREEVFGQLSPRQACLVTVYSIIEQEDGIPWDYDLAEDEDGCMPAPPKGVPLDLARGVALFIKEAPQDFAKLVDSCPDSSCVNDRFLQYAAFGELRYG